MIGDRELLTFRQGYYSLLVSLFWKEPTSELLAALLQGIDERIQGARNLHPVLGEGWEQIKSFLNRAPHGQLTETVTDEYTQLFIGPFAPKVNPYESFYLTGRLLDRPLAEIRTFLKAVGIEKMEGYTEPEDFLAFELEVMRWLIGKQGSVAEPEEERRWLQHQADFLRHHLLIWTPLCTQDIEKAKGAHFYRGAAKILQGFLEMEGTLFREWGLDKIASLEEVRRLYGALPTWKGPTFDVAGDEPEVPLPPKNK